MHDYKTAGNIALINFDRWIDLCERIDMGLYSDWIAQFPHAGIQPSLSSRTYISDQARAFLRKSDFVTRLYQATRARYWKRQAEPDIAPELTHFLHKLNQTRPKKPTPPSGRPLSIALFIGSLNPGGAERQLCNFAAGAMRCGSRVRVYTVFDAVGDQGHYAGLLADNGIPCHVVGSEFDSGFPQKLVSRSRIDFLRGLPIFFSPWTADAMGELLADPPDVLYTWLDFCNVWGGVAGLLANVPVIVLSTRNVNPTHFSYMANPIFRPWYRALSECNAVHFINNTTSGAADYAEWMNVPKERFNVVFNGLDLEHFKRPPKSACSKFRSELGIPDTALVVAGVFRLSEEKRPALFARVVAELMAAVPNLHAVLAGVGPFETEVRNIISAANVQSRFHMLGRRQDAEVVMSASDVLLLTSALEGMPNVLLEAQCLGVPVVSTRVGGAPDVIKDRETGFLVDPDDARGLASALRLLLTDKSLRERFGSAGPKWIQERFALEHMTTNTFKVFNAAFA